MPEPAIRVENLSKRYRITGGEKARYRTLRDTLSEAVRAPLRRLNRGTTEDFWALKDVSFEVQPGEVVGIIGRNGAGKSTLLKILSRITKPTGGRVTINGRVGSLLEVGTGFHPELTGRENVYLNGSILGMSRREIASKFDEIVAFAEVEKFLDTPVKRYSSGMYVRLAFAVAAHLEPEILIVDEVLAVGDAGFQKKCLGKMQEVGQQGRTVLFVSHNMAAVEQLTELAVLLHVGEVLATGGSSEVIRRYQENVLATRQSLYDLRGRPNINGLSRLVEFCWAKMSDTGTGLIDSNAPIAFDVGVLSHDHTPPLRISFTISKFDGTAVGSAFCPAFSPPDIGTVGAIRVELHPHQLAPGHYQFSMAVGKGNNEDGGYEDYDRVYELLHFQVMNPEGDSSTVGEWHPAWGVVRFPTPSTRRLPSEFIRQAPAKSARI